jgi:hypothetical protein
MAVPHLCCIGLLHRCQTKSDMSSRSSFNKMVNPFEVGSMCVILNPGQLGWVVEHTVEAHRWKRSAHGPFVILVKDHNHYVLLDSSSRVCYNTVRTPTLCKPDMSDRPYYFPFNLLNLATPLTTYAVRLVLLILVLLSSLLCYLYDAILILTSDILYSLIDTFLSILRYISTHVFVVEP